MEKEKNLTNRYHTPSLIVMLTHEDQTVQNAYEIFDAYKDSDAEYWGFKEEPLPLSPDERPLCIYEKLWQKNSSGSGCIYTGGVYVRCKNGSRMWL